MNAIEARELPTLPEMAPALERRFRLSGFAQDAITRGRMLYAKDPAGKAIVASLQGALAQLSNLCARSGQVSENKAGTLESAERVRSLVSELADLDPKSGTYTPYYLTPIDSAARNILAEVKAPLAKAKPTAEAA